MQNYPRQKVQTFKEKLESNAYFKLEQTNILEANVNTGIIRTSNPRQLYKFQSPKTLLHKGKFIALGSAAKRVRNEDDLVDCLNSDTNYEETAHDERDVELLRMIQRASQRPKHTFPPTQLLAPSDEKLVSKLSTAEDAIAFFAVHGDTSSLKYVFLNCAPPRLEFRPYDLIVVQKGEEKSEHYIMSATGVVHVRPQNPSEVMSLGDWVRESSLFNTLRKIPFFKNFLLHKALFRFHHNLRQRKLASTRKTLFNDFLLAKSTFSLPQLEILKMSHKLTTVPLIAYDFHGKHDYVVEDFRLQQKNQRQVAIGEINSILEQVEDKVGKLVEYMRSRADVPDFSSRATLEQYLYSVDFLPLDTDGSKKSKSMFETKVTQLNKMRELKRSLVEYGNANLFIRLVDIMTSENLFKNVLASTQSFFNTLRDQSSEKIKKIGFQILLVPTSNSMALDPTSVMVQDLCLEALSGCTDIVSSISRLEEQRHFKALFHKAPRPWNIGSELLHDARLFFLRKSTLKIIRSDYDVAASRMGTFNLVLPFIHFLNKEWNEIEEEYKSEAKEEMLSWGSLTKLYRKLQESHDSLRILMSTFVGSTLWINAAKLKTEFEPRIQLLKDRIDAALRCATRNTVRRLNTFFKQKIQVLGERPQTLFEFVDYVAEYKKVMSESTLTESFVMQTESLCELMDRYQVEFASDEDKQLRERTLNSSSSMVISLHAIFEDTRLKAEEFIEENILTYREALQAEVENIIDECRGIQDILSGDEFVTIMDDTEPVLQYLEEIKAKLEDIRINQARFVVYGKLLDQPPFNWSVLVEAMDIFKLREETWSLLDNFSKKVDYWFNCPLDQLNTSEIEEEVNLMLRRSVAVNRTLHEKSYEDSIAPHLLHELQSIRQNMPAIHDCGNKHLTTDHWNVVLKEMAGPTYMYHDGLTLHTLQEHNIFAYKEVLAEQSGLATGQWRINNDLAVIKQIWDRLSFNVMPYKNREGVFILSDLEDIIQQLDDHQIELQTIMASRFAASVSDKIESWVSNLGLIATVLDEWITLQKNWMYLEFIFSSDDIKKQLPEESKQFEEVDRFFCSQTSAAYMVKNVFHLCTEDGLLDGIRLSNNRIDRIQKKLEDYLETKRVVFPRFYFLSNDELLSILSDLRNPKAVQPHLSKCFDSIASLSFADDECTEIVGMMSAEGESVSLARPIHPTGSVEQWLSELELVMRVSLQQHMQETVVAYPKHVREEWFFHHPAQCIQAVDMIIWTGEVEDAIAVGSLHDYHHHYQDQILRMVDFVKRPLSKLQRTLICTLIVLDVHNRDIVQMLDVRKVTETSDFNWYQQLRCYWETDVSFPDRMKVGIAHCNAHLWYGYEYLGNQPRLVITPLTDRAFLTCTSALAMNLGAAPQGPAGTGKTESVKDLGKALARQVVVFNCSDGISYKTMSRMFAGLAQAGAWACFDEFNRIELEVLSVIAQQMLEITTALNQNLQRMNFDGHQIQLNTNFGVFVTMNPGYAGRTELPDNLKALFRPICMMIPDYALIAEIMFYSEGFGNARTLARKMVQLYKLSSEQLSKQDHYDFGMRAVKSILVMAGSLKRQNPEEDEDMLLIRAMRDSNVPKFLRDDTILFTALVRDLFPAIAIEEKHNELLQDYIKQAMEKDGLQTVEGMVTKAIQLYNTLEVRHGVMMVGQTLSGKSTILRTLQKALSSIKADRRDPEGQHPLYNCVHVHFLNPKSITMGELYGQVNDITREWTDGILSGIAREITRAAHSSLDRQWIVFDGPVDAVWIENMNTVLDDNKLLCLFNGERIKLPAIATFMFEVQDLNVASPATVSRCGMVYTEPYYLDGQRGWVPIAKTLIKQKAAANSSMREERLINLLERLVPDTLDFVRRHCKEWIPSVDAQLVINCIELLFGFMQSLEKSTLWPRKATCPVEQDEKNKEEAEGVETTDFMFAEGVTMDYRHCNMNTYESLAEFSCPSITAATALKPNSEKLFDMYFIMAFVWSFGGNLRDDARLVFDTFSQKRLSEVIPGLLPIFVTNTKGCAGSVYDLVVHWPSQEFITWGHLMSNFTFRPELSYFDLVVPTSDSIALKTLLSILTNTSRHVLVNGVTGTGKSLTLANFLRDTLHADDPTAEWQYFSTVLSAQTRSKDIENRIESKLTKARSNVLAPPPGKRAVFFVDDLNMPALEKYGASPPLELLRQVLTQGGFFDKHKAGALFKEVHDLVLLAACGVPGGGRNEMSLRLTSRFHLLCQPALSDSSTKRIFGSILHGFLHQWNAREILDLAMPLIEAALRCYQCITQEKLPTPTRSHYTFNLRDLSKVIQGMMQATPRSAPGKDDLCRLFVHEVTRTFHDRLVDEEDRRWWWSTLKGVLQEALQLPWEDAYAHLLFGDFMQCDRVHYREIRDRNQIPNIFREFLDGFNIEYNKQVELVFFSDAIDHIARICRVLRQPRGHALLAGMGGTGRQTLCKLAAFICNLPIHELVISRTFSMTEYHDSLKKVLLESGCRDKPVVFFISDSQVVYEEMLEDISSLLNTGEVPNLMQPEDIDQIIEAVRPYATAAGKKETRNTIFSHFVSMCRDHVHIILAMSPVGEQFRRRLRMFPSLVNCCTIDWFDQWPADALGSVASRMLATVSMDDAVRENLTQFCVYIHLDVQQRSEEFFVELRRRNYTTPTSYLELLNCYKDLLEQQENTVKEQINRYQCGINMLHETQTTVDEMKCKLVELQPKLIETASDTEAIMRKVEKEQEGAEVVRKECAEEERIASGVQAEADSIRTECQTELDRALPILKAAEDALAELRPDDIREVRSFQKPASRVVLVLEAVLTLLGEKDISWERAKLVMSHMEFIKNLQNYQRDELTERMIRSIQKYINNPDFQPDEVAKSSKACRSLAMWVLAINNYYEVVKVVAPKRKRLAAAEAKVAVANEALEGAQGRLRAIESTLHSLQCAMEDNVCKKRKIEDDINLTKARLGRAEQLMSGLSSEQGRWLESILSLKEQRSGIIGRMALAAGFVAYLGPFTSNYRERMLKSWYEACKSLQVPIDSMNEFDASSIVDPIVLRSWVQQRLPPDRFSVENGVVITKSRRWCLCIDPQGQAVTWIREMERDNDLQVIKLSDQNYMRVLETAIRLGLPVLLENVEEFLDATLDSVLLRQTYHSQGRVLIKVGDSEVDYNTKFRLYITTKLANPHYLPELQIKVTIINFTVTRPGLENQLLADVVRFECEELEQRADGTVLAIADGKRQLKEAEDTILLLLTSSTGNILDNQSLVTALQNAKHTSESVSHALRISEDTQRDIEQARDRYRPVATRGSLVYTVLAELAGLDHMYQNSLEFFKQLFVRTLKRTASCEDVDARVALLLPAITLATYRTICRGLFERDKLIFAFLLYGHIARYEGTIREEEWVFALKGSEGHDYLGSSDDTILAATTVVTHPKWLPRLRWNEVVALATLIPKFRNVLNDMQLHPAEWQAWYENDKAYESFPAFFDEGVACCFSSWDKLLLLKVFREDLFNYGLTFLIAQALGSEFTESPAFDLEGCFQDSTATAPIIFVLTPGTDPTQLFTEFAERKGFGSRKFMLSLGQDQGKKAEQMIRTATEDGWWVYLQNCHVYASWMPVLERLLEGVTRGEVHLDFRLWLTTMPTSSFPVLLLQSGIKVVKEPPKGLKANIRDTFAQVITPEAWESNCQDNRTVWRRLLFSLSYFHAVIQERRKFGALGWNIPYEWNQSDFSAAMRSLLTYLGDDAGSVPWCALHYMIGVINYGGRVTDFLDSRCLSTILVKFFNPEVLKLQQLNLTSDGVYNIPADVNSLQAIQEYIGSLPSFESPELFGLHANAVVSFNRNTVRLGLAAILSVQPRQKACGGAVTSEDKVLDLVTEFLRRLPPRIDKSRAHLVTYNVMADGTMTSLGTVVSHEVDFFNCLIDLLERSLTQLHRGIKGEVVMSAEMEAMFDAMLLGRIPQKWLDGGYLSRKPLASWFADTLLRVEFFRGWNANGLPQSFWISGFSFPQGFLTAVLQTFSRACKVSIDDVVLKTNVTRFYQVEEIDMVINSGVYIHGLFLEGARYDSVAECLVESRKGELFTSMPIIHLEPIQQSVYSPMEAAVAEMETTDSMVFPDSEKANDVLLEMAKASRRSETYACPVYKTAARVGTLSTTGLSTNFVVSLDIRASNQAADAFQHTTPEHWIERGVALLCMLDD